MTWHVAIKQSKLKPGKKKMLSVAKNLVLVGQIGNSYFATEALCRHMRWPLAYGAKVKDDCIRCPLHQTTYHPEDGSVNEWSPAHYFPAYGRFLGKLRKPSSLKTYDVRENDGYVEIDLNS